MMYTHPGQAEPYLPPFSEELLNRAKLAADDACHLFNKVPREKHAAWFKLTSESSAVHSNLLEQETRDDYIKAHQQADAALDTLGSTGRAGLSSAVLQSVHKELYSRLNDTDLVPGALRQINVRVQRHVPPEWASVLAFLTRADEVYLQNWKSVAEILIVTAAAHHRLQWVHPFPDGNGRAIRLLSELTLRSLGSHFWSLSAGLWRHRDEYYLRLAEADSHRLSDLDGRGNLSQKRLVEWCEFFIYVCHEEIRRNIKQL